MEVKEERELLYSDGKIKIYEANRFDEYAIMVNGMAYYFGVDILKKLAVREDGSGLERGLEQANPNFLRNLRESKISMESFGWALAKARIKEVERERDYFCGESISIENERE